MNIAWLVGLALMVRATLQVRRERKAPERHNDAMRKR